MSVTVLKFARLCASIVLTITVAAPMAFAQDTARRIVTEAVPSRPDSVKNIHRVVAAKTPSGFEVPRYVSLKFGKTNGRSGPSSNHPIVWQYRRAGLPVIIVAETENWRKIRDVRGDESWIYKAGLTGERRVIALSDTPIHKREDANSSVIAVAEKGALLRLESCTDNRCKVYYGSSYRGWTARDALWGAAPLF